MRDDTRKTAKEITEVTIDGVSTISTTVVDKLSKLGLTRIEEFFTESKEKVLDIIDVYDKEVPVENELKEGDYSYVTRK